MTLKMQLRNMNCTYKDVYSLQKYEPTVHCTGGHGKEKHGNQILLAWMKLEFKRVI